MLKLQKLVQYSICAYRNIWSSNAIFRYFEIGEFIGVLCCMFGVGSCFDMCPWLAGICILSTPSLESYPSSSSWPKVELVTLILFRSVVLLQSLGATHCSTS